MTALIKNTRLTPANAARLQPGFYDMESGKIYLSRYRDGKLAPIHIEDGLPGQVVERLDINVIAGFVRQARFYTRKQALELLQVA